MLENIWFTLPLKEWDTLLPSSEIWTFAKYNSEWKEVIRKDLPKETWQREFHWKMKDWWGYEHEWTSFRDYERYQREYIWNFNLEVSIVKKWWNTFLLIDKEFTYEDVENDEIMVWINLILNITWYAQIFNKNLDTFSFAKVNRLSWDILPSWELPFKRINKFIDKKFTSVDDKYFMKKRHEFIQKFNPDELAIWKNGYSWYVIYVFNNKNLSILESSQYWNAIYVFWKNWEELSKLTKKEILDWWLEIERVIHSNDYFNEIEKYFN